MRKFDRDRLSNFFSLRRRILAVNTFFSLILTFSISLKFEENLLYYFLMSLLVNGLLNYFTIEIEDKLEERFSKGDEADIYPDYYKKFTLSWKYVTFVLISLANWYEAISFLAFTYEEEKSEINKRQYQIVAFYATFINTSIWSLGFKLLVEYTNIKSVVDYLF
jgi:hypothetical protein